MTASGAGRRQARPWRRDTGEAAATTPAGIRAVRATVVTAGAAVAAAITGGKAGTPIEHLWPP